MPPFRDPPGRRFGARRGDPKRATHLMAAVKTVLRWRHRPGNAVTALPVWRRRCPPAANALA